MSELATHAREPRRPRARLIFAVAFAALAFQLCALGWSFTRRGSWLSNLGADVKVSGRYVGASQGKWYYANFAEDWPELFTPSATASEPGVLSTRRMGFIYTRIPPYLHVVMLDTRWTLIPNSLVVPIWLATTIRRKQRERRTARRIDQGLCTQCGFNLIASNNRCPECGQPINVIAGQAIRRLRAEEETRRLGAPMGC
jgi:hypothetical protein